MGQRPRGRVPDLLVERLALGELPPDRADALRRRLANEPGGLERLDALRASDEEIRRAFPTAPMVDGIERRLLSAAQMDAAYADEERRARRGGSWLAWAAPVALAALVALVALNPGLLERERDGGLRQACNPGMVCLPDLDTEPAAGLGPHLLLFRQRDDRPERLSPGASVRSGDIIQVVYVPAGARYGAIVSIDGGGTLTRHLPLEGDAAAKLERSAHVPLPHARRLGDGPAFERFFFITSDRPFAMDEVLDAVTHAAGAGSTGLDLKRSDALQAESFLLRKVTP